jgi:hypothetical protein
MFGNRNELMQTDIESDENSNGISTNSSNTNDKTKPFKKKQARVVKMFLIESIYFLPF